LDIPFSKLDMQGQASLSTRVRWSDKRERKWTLSTSHCAPWRALGDFGFGPRQRFPRSTSDGSCLGLRSPGSGCRGLRRSLPV
jgi:hypothetical protein